MALGDEIDEQAERLERERAELVAKLRSAVEDSMARAQQATDARDQLHEANATMLREICYRVGAMSREATDAQSRATMAIRELREATGRDAATGRRLLATPGHSPDPKAN